jgi:hypothetical protein
VNSEWLVSALPKAPDEYDPIYMDRLVKAIEIMLHKARSAGQLNVSKINASELPTSAAGLRAGDFWSDAGDIKVA